jgi:hypothetical protein
MADPEALAVFPDWRRQVTPAMFDALAEEGFDFIRMPTDPGPALAYGPGPDQDRLIDGIRMSAEMGLDAGLKVIIDLHPLPRGEEIGGMDSILGDHFQDYVALVSRIAERLSDLPGDRMALELLNEPTFDCESVYAGAPPKWPDMQVQLHAAARASAPDLTIVLTGACWAQANALASLDPERSSRTTMCCGPSTATTPYSLHPPGSGLDRCSGQVSARPALPAVADDTPISPPRQRSRVQRRPAWTAAEGFRPTADGYRHRRSGTTCRYSRRVAVTEEIDHRRCLGRPAMASRATGCFVGEFGALHTVDGRCPADGMVSRLPRPPSAHAAEEAGMGWVALWRRMGNLSVLNRRAALFS